MANGPVPIGSDIPPAGESDQLSFIFGYQPRNLSFEATFTNPKNKSKPIVYKGESTFVFDPGPETVIHVGYQGDEKILGHGSSTISHMIDITIMKNVFSLSSGEWYARYYAIKKQESQQLKIPFFLSETGQNLEINNYNVFQTTDFGIDHQDMNYYLANEKYIYRLHYRNESTNDLKWRKHEKLLKRMVASFKFL